MKCKLVNSNAFWFLFLIISSCYSGASYSSDPIYIQDKLKNGQLAPKLVVLPKGRFMMGTPLKEGDRRLYGEEYHQADVDSFAISITEITFDDFDQYTKLNGLPPKEDFHGRGKMPIGTVTFFEAARYAKWLSEQTGKYYRLPTETEWEYAAKAGSKDAFATGKCIGGKQANFRDDKPNVIAGCPSDGINMNKPVEVASYRPNQFGLFDMHGNVSEWTMGCGASAPASRREREGYPWDGERWDDCVGRVDRGGKWSDGIKYIRAATPSSNYLSGIRLVRDINKNSPYPVQIQFKRENLRAAGTIFNDELKKGSLAPQMIIIPAGSFMMGSTDPTAYSPVRKVDVRMFAMSVSEITIGDYRKFIEQKPEYKLSKLLAHYDIDYPVSYLGWETMKAYTDWLSEQTGYEYRLATSAEWEYAARANSKSDIFHGNCMSTKYGNFLISLHSNHVCPDSPPSLEKLVKVRSYPPNNFGLYDMDGNLAEMVADCDTKSYIDVPKDVSPILSEFGSCHERMVRGASYISGSKLIPVSYTISGDSDYFGTNSVGLRLVREIHLNE